jgi:hypothetical protein
LRWGLAMVLVVGCGGKRELLQVPVAPVGPRAFGTMVLVRLPTWAEADVAWQGSHPSVTCAEKWGELMVQMTLDSRDWPYAWPESVECRQGSNTVSIPVEVRQERPGPWLAADGTLVWPNNGGSGGFGHRIPVPDVVSAEAARRGYSCWVVETTAEEVVLAFEIEAGAKGGVYTCLLTRGDGGVVEQDVVVVRYAGR